MQSTISNLTLSLIIVFLIGDTKTFSALKNPDISDHGRKNVHDRFLIETRRMMDEQTEIIKQQVWENLRLVPGTTKDYTTTVTLSIANGNTIDATCNIMFPESSWELASLVIDDYKDVLKNTNTNIFAVINRLITDPNVLASEINITGLWRPFLGSHVHIAGRGMDIGNIRSSMGSGVIFNSNSFPIENDYGQAIRTSLTTNFPVINQYLSPWFMCSPATSCSVNQGGTALEKTHSNHLHLTLSP